MAPRSGRLCRPSCRARTGAPCRAGPTSGAVSAHVRQGKGRAMKHGNGKVYLRRGSSWWITYRYGGREYRESVGGALGLPPKTITKQDADGLLRSRLEEVYTHR